MGLIYILRHLEYQSELLNINALQGYTLADKDAMWTFINGLRDRSNTFEAWVNSATTVAEIESI